MSEQETNPLQPPARPPAPEPPTPDDPGSQALSEALRSSFFIIQIIMVLLVVMFFASGFFTVKEQNKAIILRMGRPVGQGEGILLGPGAHFAFPRPIDEVTNVPFSSSQRAYSSVGWYQSVSQFVQNAAPPQTMPNLNPASSVSYMLTADTNIIHLIASVTYRITDPIAFYFDFANAAGFVTSDLDNALLFTASHFTVDDILSKRRDDFRVAVETRLRELVRGQGLGITVERVDLQSAPPVALWTDFQKVDQANTEHDTTLSAADSYRSQTLGNANGQRESRINAAAADKARMVALVGAEATNFSRLRANYEANPALVTSLLQAETFRRIWTNAQSVVVLPDLTNSSMRIHLGEQPPALVGSTNQPANP
jgi:membrane protease subunit HflK